MADPVIVLVTCHDLGRHLGLYVRATVPSLQLDALGASGVVFDAAFCTAPHCSPARGSMSTGRYPHRNGLVGLAHPPYGFRLRREAVTTAAHLGAHGFGTHLFGLQHVAGSPRAWMRDGDDPLLRAGGPLIAPQHRRALHLLGA